MDDFEQALRRKSIYNRFESEVPGQKNALKKWTDYSDGTDGVIPNLASLYVGVRKVLDFNLEPLKFYGDRFVRHNGDLPGYINRIISNFFEKLTHYR